MTSTHIDIFFGISNLPSPLFPLILRDVPNTKTFHEMSLMRYYWRVLRMIPKELFFSTGTSIFY